MKLNFKEIWEGWRNHLIPEQHLKEMIAEVSQQRLDICRDCEINSVNAPVHTWITSLYDHCTECGCPLIAKSKCLSCECGHKKWLAVLTEEQEEEFNIECNDDT